VQLISDGTISIYSSASIAENPMLAAVVVISYSPSYDVFEGFAKTLLHNKRSLF
jgi:hypothetical protein